MADLVTPDDHAIRRPIAATLSEARMRTDIRYDPERLAVLVQQRLACAGWSIERAVEKETSR